MSGCKCGSRDRSRAPHRSTGALSTTILLTKSIGQIAMSTSHPVSPMMARRHHTLHPSNLNTSRSNGSLASMNIPPHAHNHKHRMNRSNKTTGGYTTRDETEVEHTAKSPVKKAAVIQEPVRVRQLVVSS
jgi:hypothetical protein